MRELETTYPTRLDVQVRFSDTDASGHVNNVSFVAYFELARTRYFQDVFGKLNTFGQGFILGEVSCRYKAQAFFGDSLVAECGLTGIGGASFRSGYRIVNQDGILVATGSSITVAYDFKAKKTLRITDEWRHAVAEHEEMEISLLLR